MPAHFGRYNFAICRRLSRASVARHNQLAAPQATRNPEASLEAGREKKNKKKKQQQQQQQQQANQEAQHLPVDYERANQELSNLITTFRMLNVDVIELCPDEDLSYQSVFIGDTAVSVNGLVLLCRPRNRLQEIKEVKQIIKCELNLPIIEINDESALLNAGDVLWTGREIFVGLSAETNESGARAVAAAFPEYSVTPVKVPLKDNLRLKSYIIMAGPDILCVNRSPEAQIILKRLEREASFNYKLITVDDNQGSQVLYLNGSLVHRNDLADSVAVLQEKVDYPRVPVKISELTLNHPFHGIDSLCILVRKTSRIQTIV